jgi:plasmid stability protein
MPGFVIKQLPEELHRKLKEQATRHHRSMTKEVLALLEQALGASARQAPAAAPFKGRFALTDRFLDKARRAGRE